MARRMVKVDGSLYRKREEGGSWTGPFYAGATPPGQRKMKFRSLGTDKKGRAVELAGDAVKEIRQGRSATTLLDRTATMEALFDVCLAQKRRTVEERTWKDAYEPAIRLHLKPWFAEHCPRAAQVTPAVLIDWVTDQLELEASAWTIHRRWTLITTALRIAVRNGVLPSNPADVLESHERPSQGSVRVRFLTEAEMRRLIDAPNRSRWRLFVLVLLFTGLRLSEALALRWEDIDFDEGVIRVRNQLRRRADPKHGWLKAKLKTEDGRRDVMLAQELASALRRYKLASRHALPKSPVFATASGQHVSQRNATREFARVVGYAGLEGGVSAHVMRHTFASILVHQNRDVAFIADQMGHANPSITLRIYAKLLRAAQSKDEARQELDRAYGPMIRGARQAEVYANGERRG